MGKFREFLHGQELLPVVVTLCLDDENIGFSTPACIQLGVPMAEIIEHIRVAANVKGIAVIDLRRKDARLRHINHGCESIAAIPIYQTIRRDDRSEIGAQFFMITDDVCLAIPFAFAEVQEGGKDKTSNENELARTSV